MNIQNTITKRIFHSFKYILLGASALLVFFSILLLCSTIWVVQLWSNLTFDEIVFHLQTSLKGTSTSLLSSYFFRCCLPSIVSFLFFIILLLKFNKKLPRFFNYFFLISFPIVGAAFLIADHNFGIINYIKTQMRISTFIEKNYVDPNSVALEFPQHKRNLIYIYVESMEGTYTDKEHGGWFDYNIIPELTELSYKSENFSGNSGVLNGGYSMPGTTWTIGGLFAETSGLPLQIPIAMNDMDTQSAFFPSITTLGDILNSEGYNQVFMMGSDATFGGRALYFKEHGNYEINDYCLALQDGRLPDGYYEWWGYEDEKLFSFAEKRLTELAKENAPFHLSLLTADTHFPDGYKCPLCKEDFDSPYANAIACASRQVADFVNWVQAQDFYPNTTIIISGDHPTMDSFCDEVDNAVYRREVYTAIINAPLTPADPNAERDYTTFDYFPTTLAALGVKIEGNRLGLGANLYSLQPTLVETYGWFDVIDGVEAKSQFMTELANINMNSDELLKRQEENSN